MARCFLGRRDPNLLAHGHLYIFACVIIEDGPFLALVRFNQFIHLVKDVEYFLALFLL